jgi:hypothetical protein
MVPAPPFPGPHASPAIVTFASGEPLPWIVHPNTAVPTEGLDGSGSASGTTGTGSTDALVASGPELGALGGAGMSGAPAFDASVPEVGLDLAPAVAQVGEAVTFEAVVLANDSRYGLPVSWTVTAPGGDAVAIAPPTWFYANGALHLEASWVPTEPGLHTLEVALGPNHTDADPSNDAAALSFVVSPTVPMLDGLTLWLDAGEGVVAGAGGTVTQWSDLSDTDGHAVQPDPGKRPSLVTDPVWGPRLVFDGVDDALALPAGWSDFSLGLTLFVVSHPDTPTEDASLIDLGNGGASDRVALGRSGAGRDGAYRRDKGAVVAPSVLRLDVPRATSVVHAADFTVELRADGALAETGLLRLPSVGERTSNLLGASNAGAAPWSGAVSAVLLYERALDPEERALVEVYLADRYGLYHPDAAWLGAGLAPAVVALAHAHRWTQPEAAAYAAWLAEHPEAPVPGDQLALWLRSDGGVAVDGAGVSAWQDQSSAPAPSDAAQTTPAHRPTALAGAVAGLPALRFDGQDDVLALPSGFSELADGLTVFAVARPTADRRWPSILALSGPDGAGGVALGRKGAGDAFFRVGAGLASGPAGLGEVRFRALGALLEPGGATTLLRDGAIIATAALAAPAPMQREASTIGHGPWSGAEPFAGDLAEVLVYRRALDAQERAQVELYLANRYGLYHPDAPWLAAGEADGSYASATVAAAHEGGWDQVQTEAFQAFLDANPTLDVPADGLSLWLQASDGVSVEAGAVAAWEDRSPWGHDAIQPSAALRPTLVADAAAGLPAVAFDGLGDALDLPHGFSGYPDGLTVVAVAKPTEHAPGAPILAFGSGLVSHRIELSRGDDPAALRYASGTGDVEAAALLAPGRWQILGVIHEPGGAATLVRDDLTSVAMLPAPVAALRTVNAIGGGAAASFAGEVAELLVYDRALGPAEQAEVVLALANRFGIYHPNAAWIASGGYAPEAQDLIHANRWSQDEADAWVLFDAAYGATGVSGVGLAAWLRADVGVGTDGGGAVVSWADQAPTAAPHLALPPGPLGAPQLMASAIGGLPAIAFDGADDALHLAPGFADLTAGLTVFAVFQEQGAARWSRMIELSAPGGAGATALLRKGTTDTLRLSHAGASLDAAGTLSPGAPRLLTATVAADGASTLALGGTGVATGATGTAPVVLRSASRIGGSEEAGAWPWSGMLAELLVYDRALLPAERGAVEVHLADKYGLYHPDATWITTSGYAPETVALIHAEQWSKEAADAYELP